MLVIMTGSWVDRIRFRSACGFDPRRAIRGIGGRAASRVDHNYMCVYMCICKSICV